MKKTSTKYYVGIDEVGRGPLAGPVTVGAFVVSKKSLSDLKKEFKKRIGGVKDSKKLSETEREEWFKYFSDKRKEDVKNLNFVTTSISAKKIDEKGISWCIKKAITTSLSKLKINPDECFVLLDGLLHAPDIYKNQKTIIKGDEKEEVIAGASIVAKVTRDNFMKKLSKKFPEYKFEDNKGYGTLRHRKAIKKYGKCHFHRGSYCRNI